MGANDISPYERFKLLLLFYHNLKRAKIYKAFKKTAKNISGAVFLPGPLLVLLSKFRMDSYSELMKLPKQLIRIITYKFSKASLVKAVNSLSSLSINWASFAWVEVDCNVATLMFVADLCEDEKKSVTSRNP